MTCLIFHVFATTLKSERNIFWLVDLYFVDQQKPSRIEYLDHQEIHDRWESPFAGASGLWLPKIVDSTIASLPKKKATHHGTTESAAFTTKIFSWCLEKIQGGRFPIGKLQLCSTSADLPYEVNLFRREMSQEIAVRRPTKILMFFCYSPPQMGSKISGLSFCF